MKIRLVRPSLEMKETALDYRKEHFDNKERIINGSERFDQIITYEDWLEIVTDNMHEASVHGDWVVTDTFFVLNECERIVGMIVFRHTLNAFLKDFGHCGYSVRPSERGKGYATEMLHQIIVRAKELGLDKLQLSVERENICSVRTIVKNGGIYERSFEHDGKIADIYIIKTEGSN